MGDECVGSFQPYPPITGYFRDQATKIDLIIVIKQLSKRKKYQKKRKTKREKIITSYLTDIVRYGLSLELENGRMPEHKHLIFIKVHASDEIIRTQGYALFYSKQFKERHSEFIGSSHTRTSLTAMQHERAYLEMIRDFYPGPDYYTTLERSQIVYDLLMNARFAPRFLLNAKPICLSTLIKTGIVLDCYALHDGPWFLLGNAMATTPVSGRQVLFTFWTGLDNFFRAQPLHVINEYLGERIGIFFAFYGAYNCFLLTLTAGSMAAFLWDATSDASSNSEVTEEICKHPFYNITWPTMTFYITKGSATLDSSPVNTNYKDNIWICPTCMHYNICPHRRIHDHCDESKWNDELESAMKLYFLPMFCFFWAVIFVKSWKRKQNYYIWFWEIDTEYVKNMTASRCCGVHYEMAPYILGRICRFLWEVFLMAICVLTSFLMLYYLLQYRYYLMLRFENVFKHYGKRRRYAIGMVGVVHVVFVYVIDRLWRFIIRVLLNFEKFDSAEDRDSAEARRVFGGSFIFTLTLLMYVAFIKGQFSTTPLDSFNMNFLGGILMENCQPLTCLDEVYILVVVMVITKELVFKFFPYVRLFGFTSDYSIKVWKNRSPYWERERKLFTDKETERFLRQKYREILMQFATTTLFVGIFPLAPLVALLTSAIDLRYCARRILLATRRPLIRRSAGIGTWWYILVLLVFLIGIFHILIVTLTSDAISRSTKNLTIKIDDDKDFLNYKTVYRTFCDYTRINGVSGHVSNRTKLGHIPLVLMPEYDYWHHPILKKQHRLYHIDRDPNLLYYKNFHSEHVLNSTIGCYPSTLWMFYTGKDSLTSKQVEARAAANKWFTEIFRSYLNQRTCENSYIYNPIHHCYFRGYYKRHAKVEQSVILNLEAEKRSFTLDDIKTLLGPLHWVAMFVHPEMYIVHHRKDLYHVYGFSMGWQEVYETYLKWWYTATAAFLMTFAFYLIYNCLPDNRYDMSEAFATEINLLERQALQPPQGIDPRNNQLIDLILPAKKTN